MVIDGNDEVIFQEIIYKLSTSNKHVSEGNMMSSPGIKYKTKVFAFYHKKSMIFKLGKGYDITGLGVKKYKFLNPFRNKPPMTAWFEVSATEVHKWSDLAEIAMNIMKSEIK
ncbi:MAG: hypothetical protein HeimC2_33570 [Candidatus Heimdallarchaeota archaeon LC_2]|nr:MAG: hypothetical protein HeimC2_33570 [Candidatus Heimdallarchaeota archaeon LC_2]